MVSRGGSTDSCSLHSWVHGTVWNQWVSLLKSSDLYHFLISGMKILPPWVISNYEHGLTELGKRFTQSLCVLIMLKTSEPVVLVYEPSMASQCDIGGHG